jgi:hypothetical protein
LAAGAQLNKRRLRRPAVWLVFSVARQQHKYSSSKIIFPSVSFLIDATRSGGGTIAGLAHFPCFLCARLLFTRCKMRAI